jgi:hypothetical protein
MLFMRPTVDSQGATSSADATTEPRPRLTKTIGSVQQTSVVTVESRPTNAGILEFMIPPRTQNDGRRSVGRMRVLSTGFGIRSAGERRVDAEDRAAASRIVGRKGFEAEADGRTKTQSLARQLREARVGRPGRQEQSKTVPDQLLACGFGNRSLAFEAPRNRHTSRRNRRQLGSITQRVSGRRPRPRSVPAAHRRPLSLESPSRFDCGARPVPSQRSICSENPISPLVA